MKWREALACPYNEFIEWCFAEYKEQQDLSQPSWSPDLVEAKELRRIWTEAYWKQRANSIVDWS